MVKAMTDKKRNVPNLRFRGFTETWEQRKLGELVVQEKNKNKDNQKLPAYSISNKQGFVPQEEQFGEGNTYSKTDKRNNYIVFPHTFAYNPARINVGSIGYQNLDSPVLVSSLYEIFRTDEQLDDSFLQEWFKTRLFSDQIQKYQEGGVRQYYFFDKLQISSIQLPIEVKEQKNISQLLKTVDHLLTLNQRKLEQLKLIKKALLQKMFADGKNSFPVIRFSGFTNAWEQRKLGDLGSLKNGMNFSKDKMGIGFPFVNLQDVFGKSIVTKQHLDKAQATDSQLRTYNLFKGDVLFVRSSVKLEGVGQAVVVPSDFINTTYSGFLIRFRDQTNLDNKFKSQIFKTRNIRTQIMSKATDSANKNINQSSLAKLKIVFPSKTEQEKIGKLLEDLDKVITLHQRKLDQLQKLKKSLLQNMFI